MKLDADTIRKHVKDVYGFKDEYNKRFKDEKKFINYVYRLSHPLVKPYLHILRQRNHHIVVSDLNYEQAIQAVIGVNNTSITKNSNFHNYSIPPEHQPTKPLKGKPSSPGICCDFYSTAQLDNFIETVFKIKPLSTNE